MKFDEAFTLLAKNDVSGQVLWFSKRSPDLAWRFLEAVRSTFEKVLNQPDGGMIWEGDDSAGSNQSIRYRMVDGFPSHVMIHSTKLDGVRILRVLHGARRITASMILDD